jgi:hypothetical protein
MYAVQSVITHMHTHMTYYRSILLCTSTCANNHRAYGTSDTDAHFAHTA